MNEGVQCGGRDVKSKSRVVSTGIRFSSSVDMNWIMLIAGSLVVVVVGTDGMEIRHETSVFNRKFIICSDVLVASGH